MGGPVVRVQYFTPNHVRSTLAIFNALTVAVNDRGGNTVAPEVGTYYIASLSCGSLPLSNYVWGQLLGRQTTIL